MGDRAPPNEGQEHSPRPPKEPSRSRTSSIRDRGRSPRAPGAAGDAETTRLPPTGSIRTRSASCKVRRVAFGAEDEEPLLAKRRTASEKRRTPRQEDSTEAVELAPSPGYVCL